MNCRTTVLGLTLALLGSTTLGRTALAEEQNTVAAEVQFATEIEQRKPIEPGTTFEPGKLYCWSKLTGGSGEYKVVHVWIRDGKEVWRRPLRARGKSWTTWSYYAVKPGSWKTQVQDQSGKLISEGSFTVRAVAASDE